MIFQGVDAFRVVGQAEVLGVEPFQIGDDLAAFFEAFEIGFERCGVHGHEDIAFVAGGEDLIAGKAELVAADAGQGTLRGPDLGGEIGEGGQVDAQEGGVVGELASGQLHAVAGVAGEFYHDIPEGFFFSVHGSKGNSFCVFRGFEVGGHKL